MSGVLANTHMVLTYWRALTLSRALNTTSKDLKKNISNLGFMMLACSASISMSSANSFTYILRQEHKSNCFRSYNGFGLTNVLGSEQELTI